MAPDNIYKTDLAQDDLGVKIASAHNFYWGVASQQEMRDFISLARSQGFIQAQRNFKFSSRFDYADQFSRADFHFFIPADREAVVLDVGSGYGNVTIPLARYYQRVVAVDASRELLEFSRLRSQAEGVNNIDHVHVEPLYHCNLPFKQKSFDVIVLNGVWEWAAHGSDDLDPQETQERVLQYLATLLKDDGVFCIGIENRLFPGWIRRDPHSKLKWTTILPRPIAHWLARRHGLSRGYQTYIYSAYGYRRLLGRAGFGNLRFYYPYTSYRDPEYIYSDHSLVRQFLLRGYLDNIFTKKWSAFIRASSWFGLDRSFVSSFYIMASRDSRRPMTPAIIEQAVAGGAGGVAMDSGVMKISGQGSAGPDAEFLLFDRNGQTLMLKAKRNPVTAAERELKIGEYEKAASGGRSVEA